MAGTITTALSNAFKVQLLKGNHDFDTSMRVILLKEESALTANFGAATVSSGSIGTNEVSHSSYDAVLSGAAAPGYSRNVQGNGGGAYVTIASTYPKLGTDGTTAEIDFQDAVFSNVTVAADGCVLYNSNAGDPANDVIAVFSFGGTVSSTAGDFTIQFPAPGTSTSILRLA